MKPAAEFDSKMIAIGQITTAQGIQGEMRVIPLTDFPERFNRLTEVFIRLDNELVRRQVESVRSHNQFILLKLREIDDRNQALQFRGALIQIPRSWLMPLPEGHYYLFQIVGLLVYTETGEYLGRVREVLRTGSNDVYQVLDEHNHREFLVPALREVVAEINLEEQKIVIRPMPGLLDF